MKFSDRLRQACDRAKPPIEWGPTPVGNAVGVSKQTAGRWMGKGQPAADTLFQIADKLSAAGVPEPYCDPRWLATGKEQTKLASEDPVVDQLVTQYHRADPRWQLSIRLLSALAVEDQLVIAGDVNMVVARILGMKPKDLRYPSDEVVGKKLGKAKHVLEREAQESKERSRK